MRNGPNFRWREWGYGRRGIGFAGDGRGSGGLKAVGTELLEGFESPVVGSFGGIETALQAAEELVDADDAIGEREILSIFVVLVATLEVFLPELGLRFCGGGGVANRRE